MQITNCKRGTLSLPKTLTALLPDRLTSAILSCGAGQVEEIRIHANRICTVTCGRKNFSTNIILSDKEVANLLSAMCGGSLYAYQKQLCEGYLTLSGGIRVGVCGKASLEKDRLIGIDTVSGLMIRLPHVHHVSAAPILNVLRKLNGTGGILLFSPPGVGKTTCLRAAAHEAALPPHGWRTVVVDAREEFVDRLEGEQLLLDILVAYPPAVGIDIAVRTLGAELIICDEIGTDADAHAILTAANRGVPILASAHAGSFNELLRRPCIKLLHQAGVFDAYVQLKRNAFDGFDYEIQRWEETDDHFENMRGSPDFGGRDICRPCHCPL